MGRADPERKLFIAKGRAALPFDPERAVDQLSLADPLLGRMIGRIGPFRLKIEALHNPFSALAESIAYQQLTGKAAATIFGRVCDLYRPRRYPTPEGILATHSARLRGCGLSRAKTLALKDLAARTLDGTVPTMRRLAAMSDQEIVERLTAVRGIGRWTVEMLLIFRLGRPDVLPVTDYGVQKGFQRTFRTRALPHPKEIASRGERWRPYRTVASWYLWRAIDGQAGFS